MPGPPQAVEVSNECQNLQHSQLCHQAKCQYTTAIKIVWSEYPWTCPENYTADNNQSKQSN